MAREQQKMRSEQVRQAILDTAMELGIRDGFEELSVRKIIKEMEYSTGVIYHHFKDKQEIIDAIEMKETQWLRSKIMNIVDMKKELLSEIESVFHMIMQLAFEQPEKYNLIVVHKYSREKSGSPQWVDYLAQRLKEAMDEGKIRKIDCEKAAFSIWSSFLGFNLMISRQRDLSLDTAEELFHVQCDIILKGVAVQ